MRTAGVNNSEVEGLNLPKTETCLRLPQSFAGHVIVVVEPPIRHSTSIPTNSLRVQHYPDHAIPPGLVPCPNSSSTTPILKFKRKSNLVCIDLDIQSLIELLVSSCSPLPSGHFHPLNLSQNSLNLYIDQFNF